MRRIASSLISYISSAVTSGSMRTYFSDLYSRSTCSLIRKLLPSNVRSTSKTTSPDEESPVEGVDPHLVGPEPTPR